ncbi:MAG TPA: helix-turn-helix domain-containing protein [Polyangiaceae bacterium]
MDDVVSDRTLEHRGGNCLPIREMLARVGDKWSILTLGVLGDQRLRFGALNRAVPGISPRVLAVTLRALERDGLVVRTAYATVPPRVEYEVTPRGKSLREALNPIAAWVIANREGLEESRRAYDQQAEGDAEMPLEPMLTKS